MIQIGDKMPAFCAADQFGKAWGEKKLYGKMSLGIIRSTFIFDEDGICTEVIKKVDTKNASAQILK